VFDILLGAKFRNFLTVLEGVKEEDYSSLYFVLKNTALVL